MKKKKKLKELTIKDNFLFGAVMMEEENCRHFLELALGFPVERVEISKEKSIVYHPEYKGVRLDIYAKDQDNTCYNVEMQMVQKADLGRRSRYYHSHIDMELLMSGRGYEELPDAYVIFICDFDPFGMERYCYTFHMNCGQVPGFCLGDGCHSIFLSTCGKNDSEVSGELIKFLEYVKADVKESERDFGDSFVRKLQESVFRIKESREMEERFMLLEEWLKEERAEAKAEGKAEGKAESVLELLEEFGEVPEDLKVRIMQERNLEVLKRMMKAAVRAKSVEEFQKTISS